MKPWLAIMIIVASTFPSMTEAVGPVGDRTAGPTIRCLGASPNGKHIAFGSPTAASDLDRDQLLGTIDVRSKEVTFFDTPSGLSGPNILYPPSWSADSKSLAFVLITRPAKVQYADFEQQMAEWQTELKAGRMRKSLPYDRIWLANIDTGRTRQLVVLDGEYRSWVYPRFSPEGTMLLARTQLKSNVAVIGVPLGWHGFLLPETLWSFGQVHMFGYDWDATAQAAYVSVGSGAEKEAIGVWRVDLATGKRERLSDKIGANSLFTSPSGQWLAFTEWANNYALGDQRRDEGWTVCVASLPKFKVHTLSDRGTERFPSWSKKEDRLAYCEKGHIAIWTPATAKTTRIAVPEGQPQSASWIGTTDSIAYSIDHREIWVLDTASGSRKRLVTAAEVLDKVKQKKANKSR